MTISAQQLELPTRRFTPHKPLIQEQALVITTLRNFAKAGQRWVTSKQLCEFIGWPWCEASRRKIRFVADLNERRIVAGQMGYCLLENATLKEVAHCTRQLAGSSIKGFRRAMATRHAYHQFLKSNKEAA